MMKKYLFFVSLGVLFLGFALGVVYAFRASQSTFVPRDEAPSAQISDLNDSQEEKSKSWQEIFAFDEPKDYSPAAERFSMSFSVDTSMLREKSRYFQLSIDKNDMYSLFCLKQTLNSFKIRYSLTRTDRALEIFLDTNEEQVMQDIVKKLKNYEINAKFTEVWL